MDRRIRQDARGGRTTSHHRRAIQSAERCGLARPTAHHRRHEVSRLTARPTGVPDRRLAPGTVPNSGPRRPRGSAALPGRRRRRDAATAQQLDERRQLVGVVGVPVVAVQAPLQGSCPGRTGCPAHHVVADDDDSWHVVAQTAVEHRRSSAPLTRAPSRTGSSGPRSYSSMASHPIRSLRPASSADSRVRPVARPIGRGCWGCDRPVGIRPHGVGGDPPAPPAKVATPRPGDGCRPGSLEQGAHRDDRPPPQGDDGAFTDDERRDDTGEEGLQPQRRWIQRSASWCAHDTMASRSGVERRPRHALGRRRDGRTSIMGACVSQLR